MMTIQALLFDPDAELQRLLRASPFLAPVVNVSTAPNLRVACTLAQGGRYEIVLIALDVEEGGTDRNGAQAAGPMILALDFAPPEAAGTTAPATARWLRRTEVVAFVESHVTGAKIRLEAAARSEATPPAAKMGPLSVRERQILTLLAEGNTSKQIAALLHLSPHTVVAHRASIMKKLHIHTLVGLVRYVLEEPSDAPVQPGDAPR